MGDYNYQEIIKDVTKQEEMLRFDHFTNDDAWELGKHLVKKVEDDGIQMARCSLTTKILSLRTMFILTTSS